MWHVAYSMWHQPALSTVACSAFNSIQYAIASMSIEINQHLLKAQYDDRFCMHIINMIDTRYTDSELLPMEIPYIILG